MPFTVNLVIQHVSIQTTDIYARADSKAKRLENLIQDWIHDNLIINVYITYFVIIKLFDICILLYNI